MMGAGKSTVGRLLAERLGVPLLDNDALVHGREGRSVASILDEDGLDSLREAERVALTQALAEPVPAVIVAAAGTVEDEALRVRLRERARVVWLRARPDTIARRIAGDPRSTERPRHDEHLAAWLALTTERREPLYAGLARIVVDVDDEVPSRIADRVIQGLEGSEQA